MNIPLSAAVIGDVGGPAADVAAGLTALGASVSEFGPSMRTELTTALRGVGAVQLVVWVPAAGPSCALLDHDAAAWDAQAAEPLRRAVACFQAAHDVLPAGGALVAVIPSLAMSGAAGFTAWTAASEGLRSLVKVAAREFGRRGIAVNAVALPAQVLAGTALSLDRPGLPAAVSEPPAGAAEAAGIIAALAGPPWTSVTGATIALDGGVWMPA